jgi:2-polyprenyl-3-methyl-5-hydroxy-6-metoxy-1,4-benzoquinol methylase
VCLSCGLVRLDPRWREDRYRRFYQTEYRDLYNPSPEPKSRYAAQVARNPATSERARWIEAGARRYGRVSSPRVVEIGAGGGWNLARLPASWGRVGFDVDEEYLEIGTAEFGIDIRYGFVDEALEAVSEADLVLLSHVVEHFTRPEEMLANIARRMRRDALLLIEVPGLFRLHRTNLDVRSYLQNAHTFTYCRLTLQDACRRAGLEVLEVDEVARAVCRPAGRIPDRLESVRPGLSGTTIRYLRLCDQGFRWYRRLRALPLIGRAAAYLWKRTYFAWLGGTLPESS